ncbi:AraC family transcriptional regulator [Spirosoma rhododendri]|uniref:Helix-turn-helix transcriptional regulator n=1 Tax=Spirosoma rhododendri TaxID=2728024 RepID=A0A7L5DYC3_9BACT|nr:AraC family transcriptional regulator [Spirosoma rhododendri]QJD80520.1 helix-turn-helix transcriptional regulator [Spirosoma rhododendri]
MFKKASSSLVREDVRSDADSSFRILVTPHLNDFYYWHFHPEYELVYIDRASGTRQVGTHLSHFTDSDLVLIGPYIPHLNFDYGVRTDYRKIVVQVGPTFLGTALTQTPELTAIGRLFDQSRQAIAFGEVTKTAIGDRMLRLPGLSQFEQFVELLSIFNQLAAAPDADLLHSHPVESPYTRRQQDRIQLVHSHIAQHYGRKLDLAEFAGLTSLTPEAFCRYMRQMTRMTFTEYVNQYRVQQAKLLLRQQSSVTDACFSTGFESLSYFNRIFRRATGDSPREFRDKFKV